MAMIIWRSVPYSGGQGLGREAAQVGAKTPIPSALEKPSNWAVVRQKPCQVFFLGFRRIFLISLRLPDGVTHHPRTLPASELLECIPVKVYHRCSLFQGGGHFRRVKLKPGLCHAKHDGGFGSSVQGCERLPSSPPTSTSTDLASFQPPTPMPRAASANVTATRT